MTAPQQPSAQPPAQPPSNIGPIVATTAIGLALVAIEARVREEIQEDVETVLATITALLLLAIATGLLVTGTELLSRRDVHAGSLRAWKNANAASRSSIAAGYRAAGELALTRAQRDMKAIGHEVPSDLTPDTSALSTLLADIDLAYGHAQTDLDNTVRDAFDGVQGENANAARQLVVGQAAQQAADRLAQRLQAAASTAVHQGSSDTQQAVFEDFTRTNPFVKVRKVWRVTASDPCGMCRALDGTSGGVDEEFDHEATTVDKDLRPVWRNLLGPPRHPHCRCQLELVTA